MGVLILTEGGGSWGLGHLTRCAGIYDALLEQNVPTTVYANAPADALLNPSFSQRKFESRNWLKEPFAASQYSDFELVIVDSYHVDRPFLQAIANKTRILMIDDLFADYGPGIDVLNCSYGANPSKFRADIKKFLGLKFLPLRKAFWDLDANPRTSYGHILFNPGSVLSPQDITHFIEAIKEELRPLSLTLLSRTRLTLSNIEVVTLPSEQALSELFCRSDLAISAGGQTIYELLRCKTQICAFSTADNQLETLLSLKSRHQVFYMGGLEELNSPAKIRTKISQFKASPGIHQNDIDGQGARRLIEELGLS